MKYADIHRVVSAGDILDRDAYGKLRDLSDGLTLAVFDAGVRRWLPKEHYPFSHTYTLPGGRIHKFYTGGVHLVHLSVNCRRLSGSGPQVIAQVHLDEEDNGFQDRRWAVDRLADLLLGYFDEQPDALILAGLDMALDHAYSPQLDGLARQLRG